MHTQEILVSTVLSVVPVQLLYMSMSGLAHILEAHWFVLVLL